MRKTFFLKILVFIFALLSFSSMASSNQELIVETVVDSTRLHYPKIQEQLQKVKKAQSNVLKSKGAFDPKLLSEAINNTGTYDNQIVNVTIEQPTPWWGLKVFSGWRAGEGDFPVYEGMFKTTDAGEVYGGLKLPLLRDGSIDKERTDLSVSKLELKQANLMVLMNQLDFSYQAAHYYWKWFSEGQKLKMYKNLLMIAEVRQRAIQQEIASGARPEMDQLDNQQFIANRQALVVEAEQNFNESSLKLSLFYRDSKGEPILPSEAFLPDLEKIIKKIPQVFPDKVETNQSLSLVKNHPMLKINRLEIEQEEKKLRLAKNQILPQLDLKVKVAQDIGYADPEEKINTEKFETGLFFNMPLTNRKAKGERQSAEAELNQKKIQYNFLFEQIRNNLMNVVQKKDLAIKRLHLTEEQWRLAEKIEQAEQTKFKEGYSDLLSVNLREEYTVKARISYLEALFTYQVSLAEYNFFVSSLLI